MTKKFCKHVVFLIEVCVAINHFFSIENIFENVYSMLQSFSSNAFFLPVSRLLTFPVQPLAGIFTFQPLVVKITLHTWSNTTAAQEPWESQGEDVARRYVM